MKLRIGPSGILFTIALASIVTALAESAGAPASHTGGFGQDTCTACHFGNNNLNDGAGSIAISGVPANYALARAYTITVTVARSAVSRRWGFQLAARFEGSGQQAGTLTPTDNNTRRRDGGTVQYITHTTAGTRPGTANSATFTFSWTSPASATGRVLFHAAGNAANNNSVETGDFIYTTQAASSPEQSGTSTTTTTPTTTTATIASTTTTTASTTTTLQPPASVLNFPRLVNADPLYTGVAVANPSNNTAAVTFTAYRRDGSILASASEQMGPRSQIAKLGFEIFGPNLNTTDSWFRATSSQPGLTGFFLTFDGLVNMMDGTDISDRSAQEFLFGEIQDAEISLVNPHRSDTAFVTVALLNNSGQLQNSEIVQIPPTGRFGSEVKALFSPAQIQAGGYLSVNSSVPIAATEVFGSPNVYTAALNPLESSGGAKDLYCPQYVEVSGSWKTTLTLINLESTPTAVTLQLRGDAGQTIGQTFNLTLNGKERRVFPDPSIFGISSGEGYVVIRSATSRIAGYVRFGDSAGQQFQTALPFVSQGQTEVIFSQVAETSEYYTGVAALNPSGSQTATITVTVFDTAGVQVAAGTETLAPGARFSKLLSQIASALPAMSKGYFRVGSTIPVMSFGVFGTYSGSVLAAVPPQPLAIR